MFFSVVFILLYLIFILQSIAFFTLLERHVLGLSQLRWGPKKVSYFGLLQPLLDGLKLLKKENIIMFNVSSTVFIGLVLLNFCLMFFEFLILPYYFSFITFYWSFLMLMILVSVNVYFLLVGGIFSKSKYSYLGGMRSAVASVGYEVMFTLNLLIFMLYSKSYTVVYLGNLGLIFLFFSFFISISVELGRTPFDYTESESELVSGFNTEYSSAGFVLIFLKEYGSLLFFSMLISTIFFYGYLFMVAFIFFLFIFIRSSLPRLRYDKMMGMMWTTLFFHISVILYSSFFVLLF